MFVTAVLCTVCGAQVYFTKLHTLLKQGLLKYFETAYSRRELNQIWIRIQTSY